MFVSGELRCIRGGTLIDGVKQRTGDEFSERFRRASGSEKVSQKMDRVAREDDDKLADGVRTSTIRERTIYLERYMLLGLLSEYLLLDLRISRRNSMECLEDETQAVRVFRHLDLLLIPRQNRFDDVFVGEFRYHHHTLGECPRRRVHRRVVGEERAEILLVFFTFYMGCKST